MFYGSEISVDSTQNQFSCETDLNQTDQITHIASTRNLLKNTFWSCSSCFLVIVWLVKGKTGWIAINRFITIMAICSRWKTSASLQSSGMQQKEKFWFQIEQQINLLKLLQGCCCIQLQFRGMLSEKCMWQSQKVSRWIWVHCSSKKFERMSREAMDVCLWVLKESNKSRFNSYSVRNSVLNISHITFWDCRMHTCIFSQTFLEIAVYIHVVLLNIWHLWWTMYWELRGSSGLTLKTGD